MLVTCGLIAVFSLNDGGVAWQGKPSPSSDSLERSAEARRRARLKSKECDVGRLLKAFDANEDGWLQLGELPPALQKYLGPLDADRDRKLTREEVLKMRGRPSQKVGEIITGAAKGKRYDDTLEVGDTAPDFTLADPSGKRSVTLSDFEGKKPVVQIFGSYT